MESEGLMDTITHSQRYSRRAAALVSVCIIVSMAILQGPTTFSWADDEVSPPPGLTPLPGQQPKPISIFVPLPPNELQKLNTAARSAVNKSPVRIKAVTDIHHANIDTKLFASLVARSITIGAPVSFQVSQGTSVTVVTDRLEQGLSGTLKWYGHIPGDPNSSVHIMVNTKDRSLFGGIRVRRTVYEIRPTPSGAHTIYTLDPTRLPPDHPSDTHGQLSGRIEYSPVLAQPDHLGPAADSDEGNPVKLVARLHVREGIRAEPVDGIFVGPPQIDVMVLYTQEAANQAVMGLISDEVCYAIDQTTTSFIKSGVQATVRLVHHGVATISEASYGGNIDNLLSDLKDPMKSASVHALRDTYGADVVSVWLSDSFRNGTTCGATTTLSPASSGNRDAAYSTVVRSCATDLERFSFVHELGHVLGANHDRYKDSSGRDPNYNWGYVRPDKGWRTIMAYNRDDCASAYCNRLDFWSNPTVSHFGDATGEPVMALREDCSPNLGIGNSPSDCKGSAYNKRTLDEAAPIVANFKQPANALGNVSCGSGGGGADGVSPSPPLNLNVQ